MWGKWTGKISYSSISSIYGTPAHRSVPAPTNSRSASLTIKFLNPTHRSAPLIWLLLTRSPPDPHRRKDGFKRRGSSPQISQPKEGLPIHPLFFSFLARMLLISYRHTDNNMIILNTAFSYKVRKCIIFTDSHLLTWYLGPRPPTS